MLRPEDPVALSVQLLMLQSLVSSHGLTFNTCATSELPQWLITNMDPVHKTKVPNLPCTILMVLFDLFPETPKYISLAKSENSFVFLSVYVRQSFPRQVDRKSRGPQGERGLEFSRRKKGQTFHSLCRPGPGDWSQ